VNRCVCLRAALYVSRHTESVVHNCDCDYDATATRNKRVHFSVRLHDVAAEHNAGIGISRSTRCGVIVYCYFHVFWLNNKGSLLLAVIFLSKYVYFIRYGT